ncbi:MAG: AAA family ATPase [Pirellulales bacterium]|nr:AAA family ATPase [Pirellulales bacterium]
MTRELRSLAEFLATPEAYCPRPAQVELHETHISWVFVTDRVAYKLKKPVRFDFVDFSTPERRRQACQAEVRLNRRLTADLYLGVLPVFETTAGEFRIGALDEGEVAKAKDAGGSGPVDWLVWMRRLPLERALDRLIEQGQVTEPDIARLAERLVQFYQGAAPLDVGVDEYCRTIEQHVRANRAELLNPAHGLPATVVRRSHGAQLRWLATHGRMLAERVAGGRVVEGHGDLRPEHICLGEPIQIFDCLEFSAEYRRLDMVDELAFLAMECDALGAEWIGRQILDTYATATGDKPPADLVSFYKSYRAAVRAKVAALRTHQLADTEARAARDTAARYLALADRYAAALGPAPLLLVRGLMGSGKSTVARALAERIGAEYLSTDEIRRELFGASVAPAVFGEGNYTAVHRRRVYDELLSRASAVLSTGLSVVLDGTFLAADDQRRALVVAMKHHSPALVINCHCPVEVARERISRRLAEASDASEARPELLDQQQAIEEPTPAELPAMAIDTTRLVAQNLESILAAVSNLGRKRCDQLNES